MKRTIGRCGNCGGAVTVPDVWMSVNPPVPRCESCGATAKPQGPTIEMNPPKKAHGEVLRRATPAEERDGLAINGLPFEEVSW